MGTRYKMSHCATAPQQDEWYMHAVYLLQGTCQ